MMKICLIIILLLMAVNCFGGIVACWKCDDFNNNSIVANSAGGAGATLHTANNFLAAFHNWNLSWPNCNKLYLADSNDGVNFTVLNHSGSYVADNCSLRDPSIIYWNGMWYVCSTNNDKQVVANIFLGWRFEISQSPDLYNWSHLTYVYPTKADLTDVNYVWAPEWFNDNGNIHIIVSIASHNGSFHNYEMHPTVTNDFNNWSDPCRITPPGRYYIDPFILKLPNDNNYYHYFRATADDTNKYQIGCDYAASLTGSYSAASNRWIGALGIYRPEGPSIAQVNDVDWRLYCQASGGVMYYSDNINNFINGSWSSPVLVALDDTNIAMGHGTVLNRAGWTMIRSVNGYNGGKALQFLGNDYMDSTKTYQSNAMTVNCWLDCNNIGKTQVLFSRYVDDDNHFEVFLNGNGYFDSNCVVNGVAKNADIYVNGKKNVQISDGLDCWFKLIAVLRDCNLNSTSGNLIFSCNSYTKQDYFIGAMDEVRVYDYALTNNENVCDFKWLGEFLNCWLSAQTDCLLNFDLNSDGIVNFEDYAYFLAPPAP